MNIAKRESVTEKAVSEFLVSIGILSAVRFTGATSRDGWECDSWMVTIYPADNVKRVNGAEISSPYYTGTGHRNKLGKPVTPHIAGIIHSLLLDASLGEESFSDFCGNCGYDTDSRKALALYLECQRTTENLRKVFTGAALAALRDLLQDY
jgi:hypothetical protein